MAYLYVLTITNPNIVDPTDADNIKNWPAEIEGGAWLSGVKSACENSYIKFKTDITTSITLYQKRFESIEEAHAWISNTKLTAADLKSKIVEWQTAHNITMSEIIDEIASETNITGSGLFS
jgi:hypothetical protein